MATGNRKSEESMATDTGQILGGWQDKRDEMYKIAKSLGFNKITQGHPEGLRPSLARTTDGKTVYLRHGKRFTRGDILAYYTTPRKISHNLPTPIPEDMEKLVFQVDNHYIIFATPPPTAFDFPVTAARSQKHVNRAPTHNRDPATTQHQKQL